MIVHSNMAARMHRLDARTIIFKWCIICRNLDITKCFYTVC